MCGIMGLVNLRGEQIPDLSRKLAIMRRLLAHRGPDGEGEWITPDRHLGLAHTRLRIIDLSDQAAQPMSGGDGNVIIFNGEIFNYVELRTALAGHWTFKTKSDTETILAAYGRHGNDCLAHLRGMFAFALWDGKRLFCARDRFGIKPFYYAVIGDLFVFASEAKAILPFLPEVATDLEAMSEYLTFQFTIGEKTLFKDIRQLPPGSALVVENGALRPFVYWDVYYDVDLQRPAERFYDAFSGYLEDSVAIHLRSDVPTGHYLSGGLDSTLMSVLAKPHSPSGRFAFHGKFPGFPAYDESRYAKLAADAADSRLVEVEIAAGDFRDHIANVIYHLDYPVAGPGAFPQYMVSRRVGEDIKVVLGGQGGDEIFGGYARYLIAYFEQCIKAAIDDTYKNGNFVVTAESIIPNLTVLREYTPLLQRFWRKGLFGPLDERYFDLINRRTDMNDEIAWDELDFAPVIETFRALFNNPGNVGEYAYFDRMTHFDFKTLLPALLQVEDRMSMAHGVESRLPILDHPLVEFAATVPANLKFKDGRMKNLIKESFKHVIPADILNRRDKMGFPVPLDEWLKTDLRDFINDLFRSRQARERPLINAKAVVENLDGAEKFSRRIWALISLELWFEAFHDKQAGFRSLLDRAPAERI